MRGAATNLRLGILIAGVLVVVCMANADAAMPPKSGRGCAGSSMLLQQNLPMGPMKPAGKDKYDTDIVNIVGFRPLDNRLAAGWLYTNRRGDLIMEVSKGENRRAAEALAKVGASNSARVASVLPFLNFVPVVKSEANGLERRLKDAGELFPCFTRPLR